MTDSGLPAGAPDPATIDEAEKANEPVGERGPRRSGATDPSDPIGARRDATGRAD